MQTAAATCQRRGVTTVELALVAPILIFLLFGIIEFGVLVRDLVGVNTVAREGARAAAVGSTPETVLARIAAAAPAMDPALFGPTLEFRSLDPVTGAWSDWQVLGSDGTANTAGSGDQIRVSVTYPHELVMGPMFSFLADEGSDGVVTLRASIIMRRE
ncbi:MAG: TadE/TadG family type IV pilus assembly protein [Armatimonadota bacterium]